MNNLNMVRVAMAYPKVHIGNVDLNVSEIKNLITTNESLMSADVIVLPELALTGYTCADLFLQPILIKQALNGLLNLNNALYQWNRNALIVVGLPFDFNDKGDLYNCAAVIHDGKILGIVPKTFLPNYREFYEKRWFKPATLETGLKAKVGFYGEIPFGTDLLFTCGNLPELKIGIEICEDVWAPIPPSSFQAIAGATLLLNLSASNETVAKSVYRREMITQQSGRCGAAYAYCSSGPTESTTDLVFGGHCILAENGSLVAETKRFEESDVLIADIDVEKLASEKRKCPTFADSQQYLTRQFREIKFNGKFVGDHEDIARKINPMPFVPNDPVTLKNRCEEIFNIQVCGLMKRIQQIGPNGRYTIGISGGLDSTLAALVAYKAFNKLGWDTTHVDAITMPGFGTSSRTLENSKNLMIQLGFTSSLIDIRPLSFQTFQDIKHKPFNLELPTNVWEFVQTLKDLPEGSKDVVFENVQARCRTMLLMNRGFVIGTGDLSELALGWCTYNGDHMSMYGVNCSIPKTLVKFLVKYVAENEIEDEELKDTLISIYNTIISPELLPLGADGQITHSTEDAIGPYELHDFFMFHFLRNSFAPSKIAILANYAFKGKYNCDTIVKWLKVFLQKFFTNQFKRSCIPDGPKVGSVSLSPRGDWRMPSDAEVSMWMNDLNKVGNWKHYNDWAK